MLNRGSPVHQNLDSGFSKVLETFTRGLIPAQSLASSKFCFPHILQCSAVHMLQK